jgi:hypothetical protein
MLAEPAISLYETIARSRGGDSEELSNVVRETVEKLSLIETSSSRPGMLFGRIQSGKTRAVIGIIAAAFDNDFDGAVILTKGTRSLAQQTVKRVAKDFAELRAADVVQLFDIMDLPTNLTGFVLNQKLIFVVKKEDDNLHRLNVAFSETYPSLLKRKWLIIDDEADLASVTFSKSKGIKRVGKISGLIDEFRDCLGSSAYLQVTATPYSLFLQPQDDVVVGGELLFRPRRPAFTVILKPHDSYIGGDEYFEQANLPDSPAQYFYRNVPIPERDALKKEDGRRLKLDEVLTSKNSEVIRLALMNFLVGGCIRRIQSRSSGEPVRKYSFLFHTEMQKSSHQWQADVVRAIRDQFVALAVNDKVRLDTLIDNSYDDLLRSLSLTEFTMPGLADVKHDVYEALAREYLMISIVNSEQDVELMLDEDGQLKLQNPLNIFIGGQILDRGITINNLIGFYYGRNPQKFQQDTVLQHSRMYGARDLKDLPVTRLYAPERVYKMMARIHEFDAALREALEASRDGDAGVYFIMQDPALNLVACSPNKLIFSDVRAVRPERRIVPTDFQVSSVTGGQKNLEKLNSKIAELAIADNSPLLIPLEKARELLNLAFANFVYEDDDDDDRKANVAILELLSVSAKNDASRGNVWLLVAGQKDPRRLSRTRDSGRFTDSPDTKQQRDAAALTAEAPVLMLLKQEGIKEQGWTGLPFWWPVIVPPIDATTTIFAMKAADTGVSAR